MLRPRPNKKSQLFFPRWRRRGSRDVCLPCPGLEAIKRAAQFTDGWGRPSNRLTPRASWAGRFNPESLSVFFVIRLRSTNSSLGCRRVIRAGPWKEAAEEPTLRLAEAMRVRPLLVVGTILCTAAAAFAFWRHYAASAGYSTRAPGRLTRRAAAADKEIVGLRPMAESVARLLETGGVDAFVASTLATVDEWNAVLPNEAGPGAENEKRVAWDKRNLKFSANRVLEQMKGAGIAPGQATFKVRSVTGPDGMRSAYRVGDRKVEIPLVSAARIVLTATPTDATRPIAGDYEFVVTRAQQFAAGWRIEAVRLAKLPAGVGDESLRRDLALAAKIGSPFDWEPRSFSVSDDERLKDFGVLLAQLVKDHDVEKFVQTATPTRDEQRAFVLRGEWGTADEADQVLHDIQGRLRTAAQALLKQLAVLGADLSDARIQVRNVTTQRTDFRDYGSLDGISASKALIELAVESQRTGAKARFIDGNYSAEVDDLMRLNGRWVFYGRQLRWRELPTRLASDDVKQQLEFENYVAEHGTLPVGFAAPDIEMVSLVDATQTKLSSLRGKVVVLDFWATDCGPCQSGLAELQKTVEAHPEWKNRVEVITVSIDGDRPVAKAHLEKRNWTRTNNQWAGDGGWNSPAATAFRVRGIPTEYVLDRRGNVAAAEHFLEGATLAKVIADELKR
jgi:thiol-disulfide isomerase/thioredoxin